ncbi:MAG: isoaspartyl peptidase/L-asparaginase [Bacteroidota bacterium]|nr:isoaspartyl peptidase/L-asparaginase [Bacteroidota bacterium]
MKHFKIILILFFGLSIHLPSFTQGHRDKIGIVIHGGAGTILKSNMTPELEKEYSEKLAEALHEGYGILKNSGTSIEAVEATLRIMEDSPLFNAGKGAVFTHEGTNELDASIMDGRTLNAGAVAAVKHIKNPITLAKIVMEKSWHVMLAGDGAEKFAQEQGIPLVPSDYFYTERRWKQLQQLIDKDSRHDDSLKLEKKKNPPNDTIKEHGTVGCVAIDKFGNIAAGTSTGGMTNKRFGRIGDSPIIGAGNYANNKTCGVSGTGDGEYFIRLNVAKDISDLMEYRNMSVKEAAETVINKLTKLGGTGGVIALDINGNIAMPFNTSGMYRGYIDGNGKPIVMIYKE